MQVAEIVQPNTGDADPIRQAAEPAGDAIGVQRLRAVAVDVNASPPTATGTRQAFARFFIALRWRASTASVAGSSAMRRAACVLVSCTIVPPGTDATERRM